MAEIDILTVGSGYSWPDTNTDYVGGGIPSMVDMLNVFSRQSPLPLDRSSMFGDYADATHYAKADGKDNRGLGGTSYIGQIITVAQNGGVDVYKINSDRSLVKLIDDRELSELKSDLLTIFKDKIGLAYSKDTGFTIDKDRYKINDVYPIIPCECNVLNAIGILNNLLNEFNTQTNGFKGHYIKGINITGSNVTFTGGKFSNTWSNASNGLRPEDEAPSLAITEKRFLDHETVKLSKFVSNVTTEAVGLGIPTSMYVYDTTTKKILAVLVLPPPLSNPDAEPTYKYYDSYLKINDLMKETSEGFEPYSEKIYLCGNETYIWDETKKELVSTISSLTWYEA